MPPANNTRYLVEASRRRATEARDRAEQAIAAVARAGTRPTMVEIARTAGVSRSWLYTQTDLVTAIGHLQQRCPSPVRTGPQPATIDSLQTRVEALTHRNTQLRAEVRDLTHRLEAAHGEIRRLRIANPEDPR